MRLLLYYIVKVIIKIGLFFYTKQIKVSGCENIPKKGAVLFTANHPNGLIDPLIIASSITRKTHFLVRASVFKKPTIAKFFDLLGMMPVYRIRNGFNQVKKNNAIFEQCENLLRDKKALLIFPEGSHQRIRSVRPLSKGFTRIVFGALAKYPDLDITIIPVGITYQNPSKYPSKLALNFGTPIVANHFFVADELVQSTKKLKNEVSKQLQSLSVHITNDEGYKTALHKLNKAQIDFTNVDHVNSMIKSNNFPKEKGPKKNYLLPLKWLIVLNSFIPYCIWKKAEQKIEDIEFVDTFRFGLNLVLFAVFYVIQACIVSYFLGSKIGLYYFVSSLILVFIYSKFSITNTENKTV